MLGKALTRLVPDVPFKFIGNEKNYEVTWLGEVTNPPTKEEIDAELLIVKKEEQAEIDAQAKKQAEREAKLTGIEFEGVMCSAHKEDQWGLDSIANKVRAGMTLPFHFKNGNVLVLTPENIDAFEKVWLPFRMSFFSEEQV